MKGSVCAVEEHSYGECVLAVLKKRQRRQLISTLGITQKTAIVAVVLKKRRQCRSAPLVVFRHPRESCLNKILFRSGKKALIA